jgi:predicted Zn-dependent peptidase
MTAAMLPAGAGRRNALELADAIEYLGARNTTGAGQHTTVIGLHTPLSKLDSALGLLADVALRPAFPAEELERQRKERLTTLTQWRSEPNAIASVLFNRTLYGSSHPYGLPTVGNEASIRSLAVADLRAFHATHFTAGNAAIIVVGNVTLAAIRARLEAHFGRWPAGTAPRSSWPEPSQVSTRTVLLVDRPGSAQSVIRIGRVGPPRSTEDYFALNVMNTILGGSFTSRLNQNLREDKGYSYGAGSVFDFRPLAGPFFAAASVQTEVTDKALAEFFRELRAIVAGVTDEEMARAKNYLALQFPQGFQSVADIAGQMQDLVTFNLPDSYFNEYITRVMQVTRADVERVARRYIDPERVAVVVVGDRARVEPGIRGLNLGPLRLLTVDEVLGTAPAP